LVIRSIAINQKNQILEEKYKTGSFTGTAIEKGEYIIIILATDNANATGTGVFHLTITDNH
jgi:hypothetical protein